jgi:hypothetical protein
VKPPITGASLMGIAFVIRAIGSDLGGERTSLVSASPQQRNRRSRSA